MSPHAGTARLAGRHAVVTGASRGIGAVIAAVLAGEGVCVSLLGRDAGNLQRVSDNLGGKGRAFPIVADLTDPPSVQSAFAVARGSSSTSNCSAVSNSPVRNSHAAHSSRRLNINSYWLAQYVSSSSAMPAARYTLADA